MRRKILLSIVALVVMSTMGYGQVGSSSANFLRVEPDARSGGMAGVGATLLDGGYAGYYNPAILGWQRGNSAGFSYSNWLPSISREYRYNYVTGVIELDAKSSLSANITYFNLGEQMATDENNEQLGNFSSYQMATGLSYGRLVGSNLSWGVGGKFIYSSLASGRMVAGESINPAGSVALDLGLLYRSRPWYIRESRGELRVGASLSNIGPGLRYVAGQQRASLPQTFRAGIAVEMYPGQSGMHAFSVSADATRLLSGMEQNISSGDTTWSAVSPLRSLFSGWGAVKRFNGQEMVHLGAFEQFGLGTGVEYWYNNLFALRGGYYFEHRDNGARRFATVGTGLRYGNAEVDFSYLIAMQENHPLDGAIRFSLKLYFSKEGYKAPRKVSYGKSKSVLEFIETYQEPAEFAVEEGIADSMQQQVNDDTEVSEAVEVAPVAVAIAPEGIGVEAFEQINIDLGGFPTMSSVLSNAQKEAIARAVVMLQRYPELTIHIGGHTDARGTQALNAMLSQARARAIYLEVLSYGILDWSRMSIEGFGYSHPKVEELNSQARQKNRRGEISLPAMELDLIWILEKPEGALVDLESSMNTPINTGKEFNFNWLEITQSQVSQVWLHSLVKYLAENPDQQLKIANVINYTGASKAFTKELGKARSELLKDLLIRLGISPSRIEALTEDGPYWMDYSPKLPVENNTEKTWFFITKL